MAFNRKPEKQILQQHRFEEFNQNSISKLISLRSRTHWHVLAESEQLRRESWNNTLSGPLAVGPHSVGAQGRWPASSWCWTTSGALMRTSWCLTSSIQRAGLSVPQQGASRKGGVTRELVWLWKKSFWSTAGLFQSPRGVPSSNNWGKNKVKNLSMWPNTCWG